MSESLSSLSQKKQQGRPISLDINVNISLYESIHDYICDLIIKTAQQQESLHLLTNNPINNNNLQKANTMSQSTFNHTKVHGNNGFSQSNNQVNLHRGSVSSNHSSNIDFNSRTNSLNSMHSRNSISGSSNSLSTSEDGPTVYSMSIYVHSLLSDNDENTSTPDNSDNNTNSTFNNHSRHTEHTFDDNQNFLAYKKTINLEYKNLYALKKNKKILSKPFVVTPMFPMDNILPYLKENLLLKDNDALGFIRAHRSPGGKVTKFDFVPLNNDSVYTVEDFKRNVCYPRYKSHMRIILVKTNVQDITDTWRPIKFFLNSKEYLHHFIWKNKSLITNKEHEHYLPELDGNKNTEVWVFHSSF
ncbi:hypothetical protein ACO0QE_002550 [Hanseniaspora vineae]